MPEKQPLRVLVVYDHPLDFPRHVVVREWAVLPGRLEPDPVAVLFESVQKAREAIAVNAPGATLIPRAAGDDPVIVESWLL
jgi:hypothetical protein